MTEEIFVRRGVDRCLQSEKPPCVGVRLRANIFWLGRTPFSADRRYFFKCGTAKVEMRLEKILRVVNASDLNFQPKPICEKNEVAECILRLERPVAFDLAGTIDATSRFGIVDGYEIAGGGVAAEALRDDDYDARNLRWSGDAMTAAERTKLTGRRGLVVWMTGLSGSGKTTIAQEAERRLEAQGIPAYLLDGDKLRRGLNADLDFTDGGRRENMRRVAQTANLFRDAGIVAITTLISPFEAGRAEARRIAGGDFLEVYVKASLQTCARRDPKGLFKKASAGGIEHFTGISSPYEAPRAPELVLDTETLDEEACVEALMSAVLSRLEDSGL